ncbi:P1 family peptidase [Balneola sp. MJW-20]|uniref:P1 family peptidase n=1 Tax=Gracilimonas aurantiaca TaxID=3234185 RepID=UPI0034676D7F
MIRTALFFLLLIIQTLQVSTAQDRMRMRDYGIKTGILTPGKWNAITDVEGVSVGHHTLIKGDSIHTGVTVIMPHSEDLYRRRVPAAVYVGNGYGKALGFTQVRELGEIETPIGLTNTLSIHSAANGIADYMLTREGNENIRSINPVVGETNDGYLNDIRKRVVNKEHIYRAINDAASGPVAEGNVGAGAGTRALGFKGGIGTSSRVLPKRYGSYTVGVLVQSNFGGILTIDGVPVGEEMKNHYLSGQVPYDVDGSCMIIVATDAPLSDRNLERLAKRAFLGIARVGGFASNGSGDYVIAFSNNKQVLRGRSENGLREITDLDNNALTPLFLAAVEATEEAILNSLFMAETVEGHRGSQEALPVDEVLGIMRKYGAIE